LFVCCLLFVCCVFCCLLLFVVVCCLFVVVCCLLFVVCCLLHMIHPCRSHATPRRSQGPSASPPALRQKQPPRQQPPSAKATAAKRQDTCPRNLVSPLEEEAIHQMLDASRAGPGEARGPGVVHAIPVVLPPDDGAVVPPGQLSLMQQDRQEPVASHAAKDPIAQGCNLQPFPGDWEGHVKLAHSRRARPKSEYLQKDAGRHVPGHKMPPGALAPAAGAAPVREVLGRLHLQLDDALRPRTPPRDSVTRGMGQTLEQSTLSLKKPHPVPAAAHDVRQHRRRAKSPARGCAPAMACHPSKRSRCRLCAKCGRRPTK